METHSPDVVEFDCIWDLVDGLPWGYISNDDGVEMRNGMFGAGLALLLLSCGWEDVGFTVTADEAFVHEESILPQLEQIALEDVDAPDGVTVSLENDEDMEYLIRFEGTLAAGEYGFKFRIEHIGDMPSEYEKWDVTITAQ